MQFQVIEHNVDFDQKNSDAIVVVIKMVERFFSQGKANNGMAVNPVEFFNNDREFEVAFMVIAGFCKEGSSVVVADAANPWVAKFRWVVQGGKIVKQMPKISWENANANNNNQQNNNKPANNNNQGQNNQQNNSNANNNNQQK